MKKIMTTFVFTLLVVSMFAFVSASSEEVESFDIKERAGIAPGNFFYGFDKAFEKVGMALTFDKEKKATKALNIAEERLAEAEYIAENGHFEKAKNIRKEYAKYLGITEQAVEDLYNEKNAEKSEESLRKVTRIEGQIERHEMNLETFEERAKQRQNGEPTAEQRAEIEELISQYKKDVSIAQNKIREEKEKFAIKHKALTNLSDRDMNILLEEIQNKEGFKGQGWKPETPERTPDSLLSRTATADMLKERLNTENLTDEERERIEHMISSLEGNEMTNDTEARLNRFYEHREEVMQKYEAGDINIEEMEAQLEALKDEDGKISRDKAEEFRNAQREKLANGGSLF